jgi:cysteinyl-tRNA synthetase
MGKPFRIYNTLSRSIEDFVPKHEGEVKLYVCGMTVYDHCHVGHARAMVIFDTFVRYLRHRKWRVEFVRNFTDVDDKIIARALDKNQDPAELAQGFIDAFRAETKAMGLMNPDHEPRVSECLDEIRAMIQSLIDQGYAYPSDGSVWFSVETYDEYGGLSNQKVEELRNPETFAGKKKPADFALWKAAKDNEPSWESDWGPGRPGWHIECSAMAKKCLGDEVDIHGGGLDLVFPHHENEIAQSTCANQHKYVRYWMHNGLLTMASGQKMGKSLGNVINVHEALASFPAETLRLYYLQNHYRSPLPWGDSALSDALGMLARLYESREKGEAMGGEEDAERVAKDLGADALSLLKLGQSFDERFYKVMDDDFNTAQALGFAFGLARAINRFSNHKKAVKRGGPIVAPALRAFKLLFETTGLLGMKTDDFHEEVKAKRLEAFGVTRAQVEDLVQARNAAREEKDWTQADALRDQLSALNIEIRDLSDGVQWRVLLCSSED